jgi:hypothetical protein
MIISIIPMLLVVNEENRPRIHEKGSDIARAAKPSCLTYQTPEIKHMRYQSKHKEFVTRNQQERDSYQ